MPASKHQLAASAYHLRPADVRKLLLVASNFRDRCLIKTLWWMGVHRSECIHLDIRSWYFRYVISAGMHADFQMIHHESYSHSTGYEHAPSIVGK